LSLKQATTPALKHQHQKKNYDNDDMMVRFV